MPLRDVILPDLGAHAHAAIVVSHWYATLGEWVLEGDRLVEMLVGAATIDVPAPVTGRLVEIREPEDNRVPAGAVLGRIEPGESPEDPSVR
jgi:pyruvate/2-oxoglutarate dehydrogenase complex dihydrolipoamide acyltransferase (E2) component